MRVFCRLLSALTILFCFELLAQDETYVISTGETLSEIARRSFKEIPKVYGSGGRLETLLSMNPHLKNPDLILTGQTIVLKPIAGRDLSDSSKMREVSQAEPARPVEILPAAVTHASPPAKTVEEKIVPIKEAPVEVSKLGLSASVSFSYFKIDAEDTTTNASSTFLSSLSPELTVGLIQPISPELNFFSELKYKSIQMEPLSTGQSVDYADSLTSISAGLLKNTEKGSSYITLGSRSSFFVRSTTLTAYRLDSVSIPFVSVGFSRNLYSYKSTRFSAGADFTYLSSAEYFNYKVKPGLGYLLKAESISSFTHFDLGQQIYFAQDEQDSSISSQSLNSIGLRFVLIRNY